MSTNPPLPSTSSILPSVANPSTPAIDRNELINLVNQLLVPIHKEQALIELSKRREHVPDLAPILWFSRGNLTICAFFFHA